MTYSVHCQRYCKCVYMCWYGGPGKRPPRPNYSPARSAGMDKSSKHQDDSFFLCFIHDVSNSVRCGMLLETESDDLAPWAGKSEGRIYASILSEQLS